MTSKLHRLALFWQRFTPAQSSHEQLLWWWLRLLWFPPWQVKRQVEIPVPHKSWDYSADIAIIRGPLKVDIEVDGRYWHRQGDTPRNNAIRDDYMEKRGWLVQRYNDNEVEMIPIPTAWHATCMARARWKQLRGGLDLSLILWWGLVGIGCLGWIFFFVWWLM